MRASPRRRARARARAPRTGAHRGRDSRRDGQRPVPGLDGVLPDFGRFTPLDWGLGVELKGAKAPHWSGTRTSPQTFGHFGGSGTFLWVDPERRVACAALTTESSATGPRTRGRPLSDAVLGSCSPVIDGHMTEPIIRLEGVSKRFGQQGRGQRRHIRCALGALHRLARPERLRQDDLDPLHARSRPRQPRGRSGAWLRDPRRRSCGAAARRRHRRGAALLSISVGQGGTSRLRPRSRPVMRAPGSTGRSSASISRRAAGPQGEGVLARHAAAARSRAQPPHRPRAADPRRAHERSRPGRHRGVPPHDPLVRRARGRTVFISSHLLDEVEKIADDIAIVQSGRLVLHGTVAELVAGGNTTLRIRVDAPDRAEAVLGAQLRDGGQARSRGKLDVSLERIDDESSIAITRALVEAGIGVAEVVQRERVARGAVPRDHRDRRPAGPGGTVVIARALPHDRRAAGSFIGRPAVRSRPSS